MSSVDKTTEEGKMQGVGCGDGLGADAPTVPEDALRITTLDGKYTVVLTNEGRLHALRYGQPWRDCIGDGLILALAQDIETLRARLKTTQATIDAYAEQAIDDGHE